MQKTLIKLRKDIDQIDGELAKLLKKRAQTVFKIKKLKKVKNLPVIDAEREKKILKRFKNPYLKAIFSKIVREFRKLQKGTLN